MEAIRDSAERALDMLETMDIIHSFQSFKTDCQKSRNKLLILGKIYHKPYFQSLTITHLEQIIDDYGLPIDVEIVGGKHKLKYNPRNPWEILRLLDDNYADAALSHLSYHVKGKSEIQKRRR